MISIQILCLIHIFYVQYMYFMMSSTHILCAIYILYDVQDTLYDQYTYFMSISHVLFPVYIFYVHYTYCMMSSTHRLCPIHIFCVQ